MNSLTAKQIIFFGLFIALEVILTRFLSIQTPIVRIGFTFIPIAVSAIMFGPLFAGVCAALADVLGMVLFPSGAFFPGFTASAFLTGAVYGLALYGKPINIYRISAAAVIVSVFINLGLDTLWLEILTGQGILALLPVRLIKCIIMIPLQILILEILRRKLPFLERVRGERQQLR